MKLIVDEEYWAFLASIFGNLGGSSIRNLRCETDRFGGHLPLDDCAAVCVRLLRIQMGLQVFYAMFFQF